MLVVEDSLLGVTQDPSDNLFSVDIYCLLGLTFGMLLKGLFGPYSLTPCRYATWAPTILPGEIWTVLCDYMALGTVVKALRGPGSFLLDRDPASDRKRPKEEQVNPTGQQLIAQLVSTTGFWHL